MNTTSILKALHMKRVFIALAMLACIGSSVMAQTYRPLTGTRLLLNSTFPTGGSLTLQANPGTGYTLTLPSSAPTANQILANGAVAGTLEWKSPLDLYDFTNGLTETGSNTIELGGALTKNTTIDIGTRTLSLSSNTNGTVEINADLNVSSGNAVIEAVNTLTLGTDVAGLPRSSIVMTNDNISMTINGVGSDEPKLTLYNNAGLGTASLIELEADDLMFLGSATIDGTTLINTTNTQTTTIGNATGAFELISPGLNISSDGVISDAGGDVVVDDHLVPMTDDAYKLGSDVLRWADVFIGPASLHVGSSMGTAEVLLGYNLVTNTAFFSIDATANILTLNSTNGVGINGALTASSSLTANGNTTIGDAANDQLAINATITSSSLVFEGATNDGNETTISITDPTADRTITLPDQSGTLTVASSDGSMSVTGNFTVDGTTTLKSAVTIGTGDTGDTVVVNSGAGNNLRIGESSIIRDDVLTIQGATSSDLTAVSSLTLDNDIDLLTTDGNITLTANSDPLEGPAGGSISALATSQLTLGFIADPVNPSSSMLMDLDEVTLAVQSVAGADIGRIALNYVPGVPEESSALIEATYIDLTGLVTINTSGTAGTEIGNGTGSLTLTSSNFTLTSNSLNITSDGEISNALGNVVISDNLNVTGTGTNNIGVAGATNTILGTTTINSTGTAATTIGNSGSTVTVGSLSTALNSSVPSGYDRIVIANSDGRLEQASISAVVTSSAWGLSGNSTSDAWNGTTGSRLGTTSAQPLVLATTNATAQDIRFYTGNNGANERMRITGTGNVGIGTGASTPVGRLQVVGGAITPAVGSGTDAGIVWPADPGGGGGDIAWIKYFAESGENTTLEIGIANDSDDDISFKVGAVQVMSMQNTVVTVSSNLTVTGNTTLGNATTDAFTLTSSGLNVTSAGVISDFGGAVEITDALTVVGATNINATGTATTTIGNTGGTLTMTGSTIGLTGNVTANNNLSVNGNTTLGNAATDVFTLTSSGLNVTSDGVISDDGGAVEITDALTVVGATNINATGTAATTIGNTDGTLTMTGSTIGLTGNVTANDNLSVNGNTTLGNAATDVFTLTSSGLNVTSDGVISDDGGAVEITDALTVVGATNINATGTAATTIGNTGATITLGSVSTTLNGSVPSGYDRVVIANSDGRLDQVSIASISGASTWSLTGNDPTEGTHFLGTTTGKRLEFRTNNVERMRIASDGNVSIGTTTTSHPLTVSGNATTSTLRGPLYVASNSDATNNGVSATLDATNDGGNIFSLVAGGSGSDVPGGFGIYQSGTAYRMAINTDGEVHIGALSSSTDHSSFGSTLNVRGNASIGAAYWDDAAPSNGLLVEGSVGIGNTSPSHKLDVTGTFRATGLITGDAGLTVSGAAVSINASSNFATDINTGTSTGAVTIGGSAAQTIDIGTGANNKTVNLGSTNGASTTTIYSGSGSLKLNVDNNQTTNINTGTSTGAVNIGTGSASGTVSIGRSDGTTTVIGTTSINASVNNATNINTGTSTGAVNIGNSGSTVTVLGPTNINTTGAQATTIGNTGATASILGGLKVSVKEVTTAGNHTVGNNAVVVVTGGMVADDQIQLPDISAGGADGRIVIIRNARTNTIDVATFAGVVVVDNLAADASVTLIAVGTAWYQIGN